MTIGLKTYWLSDSLMSRKRFTQKSQFDVGSVRRLLWSEWVLQSSPIENLILKTMVLGGEVFGEIFRLWRLCSPESINAIIRGFDDGVCPPILWSSAFHHMRTQHEDPHLMPAPWTWISQPSVMRIIFCSLLVTQSVEFCYSNTNRLRV